MADDLSLLFRLRGDAAGLKAATAEGRAAVNQLKQSFGPELTQTVSVANQAFSNIADNLNVFVGQRIPLVGGAFVRVTENLRGLNRESAGVERKLEGIGKAIQSIATESGKSVPQIGAFLTKFVQIEGQAKRDKAAIDFFGAALGAKLVPELEKTGAAMAAVSAESAAAGGALASLANPITLVIAAIVAANAVLALMARELFNISRRAAEFQGRMFDLSQQTGVAVETLSALEVVAKTTGGEIGNLIQALVTFQRRLDDTSDPNSKATAQFKELGIQARDTETAFRQALAALARMPEGFQQTAAAAELFGARSGKQLLAVLKETNGDLDAAIKRFRELGILISESDARAADRFNDELALLQFQIRSLSAELARDLIPELTGLVRSFSELVRAGKPLLGIIGSIAGPTVRAAAGSLRGLGLVVQALTLDFDGLKRSIREMNEEAAKSRNIPALTTEGPQAVPLPTQQTPQQQAQQAAATADLVVQAAKRAAAAGNQALDQLFEQGRINREKQAEETIALNKKVLDAELAGIETRIAAKQQEFKSIDRERLSKQEVAALEVKLQQEADKLNQDRLDKQAEFERTSAAIRARAAQERADSLRSQVDNETNILIKEFDRQIKATEAAIARGAQAEADGLTIIEALEKAKIDTRIEGLEQQKRIGFLTIQEQKDLDKQIQQLQQERDHLEAEQQERRLARIKSAAERERQIQLANLDTLLEVEQIRAERLIAANEALAEARVQSEEETARRILAIRLRLIDAEIEATEAKLGAAGAITDVNERLRTQAELNNRLKVLGEQRKAIQDEGNREIDEGRREDLENERRYADELRRIKEEIRDIERDAAREVLNLMRLHFASRRDIARLRLQSDIADENSRHRQAEETIRNLEQENRESNRTQAEKDEQQAELNRLREAEAERHRLAMKGIEDQGRKDEDEASPFGRIGLDVDNLKEFASVLENSIVPLGELLTRTFGQVADAIGQTVANWVLLGETGPAVMRKILAQALASLAAEAAVNAIKELALGFATLFFNPAESAAHFTAAGLWAAIGGVAAVAGRSVAGNLFKSKSAGAGAGGGSEGDRGQLDPLRLERNTGERQLTIRLLLDQHVQSNDSHIVRTVVRDFQSGGDIREVVNNDGVVTRG